ncbi:unnamed protein product [Phaedon cochleariae]|uniref:Peptidase S1 domain-containing protein n=1 Tax=Phaedon cochleariae TaxID=80249 RepID=A0A9P0DCW4_PHACE|nr:unnamed protein product [Phaedon cochleariae]
MSVERKIRSYLLIWTIFSTVPTIVCDIGGRVADEEEVSHQVSLHLSYNDEFLCGGVIVSPTEVVTVADRLYYTWGGVLPKLVIRIRAGRRSLNEESYQEFEVEDVVFHPDFDKKTMENNIAVLRTSEQLPFYGTGEGIAMEKVVPSSNCSVIGWNQGTLDLRVLDANVVQCGTVYSSYSGNVCVRTIDVETTLCEMSEGSSLTCDNRLVALLSIPLNCDSKKKIAVFERVTLASTLLEGNETISDTPPTPTTTSAAHVVANSFRILNLITAVVSFVFSLIFQ